MAWSRPVITSSPDRPNGAVILASNHLAVADSFYLCLVVRRRITYLAKAEYFTGKGLKGWATRVFFQAAGQLPIDRSGGKDEALRTKVREAVAELDQIIRMAENA